MLCNMSIFQLRFRATMTILVVMEEPVVDPYPATNVPVPRDTQAPTAKVRFLTLFIFITFDEE